MDSADQAEAQETSWLSQLEKLHPAVVSDCLDKLGFRHQVMAPHIRPLYPQARIAGVAMTVHVTQVDQIPDDQADWYKGELAAVDSMGPRDVMVVSTCPVSYWGELLATAGRHRGARGIVAGINACDSLGRLDVDSIRTEISCGGVRVNTGDLILADYDGVVVIPRPVAPQALALAAQKMADEDVVRVELAAGIPFSTVYQTYGII